MRRVNASGSVASGAHTANLYRVGPEVDIAARWSLSDEAWVQEEALVGMNQQEDRVRAEKARAAGLIGLWEGGLRYPRTARELVQNVQEGHDAQWSTEKTRSRWRLRCATSWEFIARCTRRRSA